MKRTSLFVLSFLASSIASATSLETSLKCTTSYKDQTVIQDVTISAAGDASFTNSMVSARLGFADADLQSCSYQSDTSIEKCRQDFATDTKRTVRYSQYFIVAPQIDDKIDAGYKITMNKDTNGSTIFNEDQEGKRLAESQRTLKFSLRSNSTSFAKQENNNLFFHSQILGNAALVVTCFQP